MHHLDLKGVDFRFGVEARGFENDDDLLPGVLQLPYWGAGGR